MATPNRNQIVQKAMELWHEDHYDVSSITPTESELREGGYVSAAMSQLMRDQHRAQIESDYIDFPQEFTIDIEELLRSGFYVTGTTGSGKSDIGMYAADKLMQHGVIVIVFDSTQDWQSRSSIPYYQTLQSVHIDEIPKESMIYDIHRLYPDERQELVEKFCAMLYMYQAERPKHMRKQYFMIFEEAQIYLWQNSLKSRKTQNTAMLLTEGRNYKVRFGCIVQFSSMIDKNAMRYMKQRYLGWTNEKNDVEYLRSFIGDKVDELKSLQTGQFIYSHPSKNTLEPIEIEAFESTTKPKRLELLLIPKPSIPQPTPKQQHNDPKTISGIVLLLIWLLILYVALR